MTAAAALLAAALFVACAGEPVAQPEGASEPVEAAPVAIDPPAAKDAFAPHLATADGRLLASWLEEAEIDGSPGHRLVVSVLEGGRWRPPVLIAAGTDFFANWADFPAVVEAGDGVLLAHWLAKTGQETYAYSIRLARSLDGGRTWAPLGRLNDDATPTEHGFVSWLASDGAARAFWLDGRAMAAGGAMALRTARVGAAVGASEVLDDRVCECCATGAAQTEDGPLVVYRDRAADETRDIAIVRRRKDGSWTGPARVAADGWKIPGCPVNGPRVAAAGERVAVAWFTAAGAAPTVKLALSEDRGASFAPAITLDAAEPLGRVDIVLDGGGAAWVVWLAKSGERAAVTLSRVTPEGQIGEPLEVAETDAGRLSGFPRLERVGKRLFVAWTELGDGEAGRVRVAEISSG